MEEPLVKFETAKLAQEKGFNEPCFDYYSVGGLGRVQPITGMKYEGVTNTELQKDACISVPTQSLLKMWLRKKHDIHVQILALDIEETGKLDYVQTIYVKDTFMYVMLGSFENRVRFSDYENALETGLQEALNLIKS